MAGRWTWAIVGIVVLATLGPATGPAWATAPAARPEALGRSIIPPIQSCDDAYDQTGVGGAGIGQLEAVGNGFYSFSVAFNSDFIASLPPTTEFVWGQARVYVNETYAFAIPTGHVRPLAESFHGRIQLQGYRYGRGNRRRIQRGDFLTFRLDLLLIDPESGTFYPGHGTISCRL